MTSQGKARDGEITSNLSADKIHSRGQGTQQWLCYPGDAQPFREKIAEIRTSFARDLRQALADMRESLCNQTCGVTRIH